MSDDSEKVRTGLLVIVGSFAVAIALFLGVAWFIWHGDPTREAPPTAPLISNVSAAALVAALLARAVVRRLITSRENGWQQFVILGAAMIEFAGLFGAVAYFLEGTDLALGVGVVAAVLLLALQLPTRNRWERWTGAGRPGIGDALQRHEM